MASSAILRLLCAVLVCIMVVAPHGMAAITCGDVSLTLAPCLGFLENGVGPSKACCNGVKTLNKKATTAQDRRTACTCIKSTAAAFPSIKQKNSAALPLKCGVNVPGDAGPQTDCSKVN